MADLRSEIEALADEWDRAADRRVTDEAIWDPRLADSYRSRAADLRAVLARSQAPQAPAEPCAECRHPFERHNESFGCCVEVGNSGSGSVADAVFCRCRAFCPSVRPATADDEGVRP